jgi:WD40 repeat protein
MMMETELDTNTKSESGNGKLYPKTSVLAILSAVSVLLAGGIGAALQGFSNTRLERQKFESQLIQKALETKDKNEAAKNLLFLVDSGVIQSLDGHRIKEIANSPEQLPIYSELLKVASSGGSLAISPDGKSFIVGNLEGTASLWDVDSGRVLCNFSHGNGAVKSVAFAQNGKTAITAGEDKSVKVWNLDTRQMTAAYQLPYSVLGIGVSPDGKKVYIRSEDNKLMEWRLDELKNSRTYDLNLNTH